MHVLDAAFVPKDARLMQFRLRMAELKLNRKICLGCGVCTRFCPIDACKLETRPEKVFVPKNTFEKVALQAIDQGKIGNFIFDNQTSTVHKVLRGLVNGFVKLPTVKRVLLQEKVYTRMFKLFSKKDRFRDNEENESSE